MTSDALFRKLVGRSEVHRKRCNEPGKMLRAFRKTWKSVTISYFELGYFEFPAISNSSFFPYTLNQPRYFELVKNRVQEETPKRPTKSEVRQAIETLSRYSLFAVEEPRFEGKQASCHSRSTKVLEKNKNNKTFKDFSMQHRLLIYPT